MAGIKIINVLKDDTFPDILELFRQAPQGEVIFVLPKTSKVFHKEDHFAVFASEAQQGGKTISVLASNPTTTALAHKYKFHVMAPKSTATTLKKSAKVAAATLASQPLPGAADAYDDSDSGVPLTSDETPVPADEPDEMDGYQIEDEDGPVKKEKSDDDLELEDEGVPADLASATVGQAITAQLAASAVDGVRQGMPSRAIPVKGKVEKAARVPVQPSALPGGDLDYIDAMWRDKATQSRPIAKAPGRSITAAGMSKSLAVGILAISAVVLAAIVYITTGSAHISVVPVSHAINTTLKVQASDATASIDTTFGKIPGQLFQVSKTATQDGTATGSRDVASKARGTITISNTFSSAPQTMVATTRFADATGHIYRTLQSITVPGSTVKNGQVTAGTTTVQIIADKAGTEYNIPAGTFTVVAFKEKGDTDRYEKITGKSTEPITGGASGPSTVVTQADYDKAKTAATADVKEQIKTAFAQQSGDMMILDKQDPTITKVEGTAKPDDAATAFTVSATGTLNTVAFRADDLKELIIKTIAARDHMTVLPEQLEIGYTDIVFKEDTGTLAFTVTLKGFGFDPLDTDTIKSEIAGKNAQQIQEYFTNKEGVDSASVNLSPFWVRSVPENSKKINLEVDYKKPSN